MYYAFNLVLHLKCFLHKLPHCPMIRNYSKSNSVPNSFTFSNGRRKCLPHPEHQIHPRWPACNNVIKSARITPENTWNEFSSMVLLPDKTIMKKKIVFQWLQKRIWKRYLPQHLFLLILHHLSDCLFNCQPVSWVSYLSQMCSPPLSYLFKAISHTADL